MIFLSNLYHFSLAFSSEASVLYPKLAYTLRTVPDCGFKTTLFDAKNGFNKVNRYQMLWSAAHCWTKACQFAFNHYCHQNTVYVRNRPGKPPIWILSREGIAQGCSLSMNIYGVVLLPLLKRMRVAIPDALAPAYVDDAAAAGKAVHNWRVLVTYYALGPGTATSRNQGSPGTSTRRKMRRSLGRHSRRMTWTSNTLVGKDTWVASLGAM
jgi:hypothetical protein